jgi:hypothetical protein
MYMNSHILIHISKFFPNITTSQEHSILNCHVLTIYHGNKPPHAQILTKKRVVDFIYHHLFTCVGFTSLLPKFTVTRLCSATVLISNGKACSELVSATGVGAGALAAIWL